MALSASAALWFLIAATPIGLWVAWSDLSRMKIPNKAVLALIAVYLVIGILVLPLNLYLAGFVNFGVVLLIGFVLSLTGLMGAGDAKFGAAMALFVARLDATNLIAILAVCALVGFVTHRVARMTPIRRATPNWESWDRKGDFPMGFPLAGSLLIYLAMAASYTSL